MALNSYAALQTSIADWLNRTDLTAPIVDFIALNEAEMKRRIRRWTVRSSAFTIDSARVAAPTDLVTLRSIRLITGSTALDRPLRVGTIEMLNERKARQATTGRPDTFAYVDGYLYAAPEPDQTYTAEIFYISKLTALSVTNTSNSVLVEAPDAYLFGALAQAEPYLEHDERVPMWTAKFDKAIEQLNAMRDEEEFNASTHDVRLPMTFG